MHSGDTEQFMKISLARKVFSMLAQASGLVSICILVFYGGGLVANIRTISDNCNALEKRIGMMEVSGTSGLRQHMVGDQATTDRIDASIQHVSERVATGIAQMRMDMDTERKRTDERVTLLVGLINNSLNQVSEVIKQNNRLIALIEAQHQINDKQKP